MAGSYQRPDNISDDYYDTLNPPNTPLAVFVDDTTTLTQDITTKFVIQKLQTSLNKITIWSNK